VGFGTSRPGRILKVSLAAIGRLAPRWANRGRHVNSRRSPSAAAAHRRRALGLLRQRADGTREVRVIGHIVDQNLMAIEAGRDGLVLTYRAGGSATSRTQRAAAFVSFETGEVQSDTDEPDTANGARAPGSRTRWTASCSNGCTRNGCMPKGGVSGKRVVRAHGPRSGGPTWAGWWDGTKPFRRRFNLGARDRVVCRQSLRCSIITT
jgi:hypothetical protein